MIFDRLTNEQLLDLHAQVRTMLTDSHATGLQHQNLLTLADKVEDEICLRCSATCADECIVPGPKLRRCKYAEGCAAGPSSASKAD